MEKQYQQVTHALLCLSVLYFLTGFCTGQDPVCVGSWGSSRTKSWTSSTVWTAWDAAGVQLYPTRAGMELFGTLKMCLNWHVGLKRKLTQLHPLSIPHCLYFCLLRPWATLAQVWSEQTGCLRRKPQAQKSLILNQALSELEEPLTVWTQTSTLGEMFLHPELPSAELLTPVAPTDTNMLVLPLLWGPHSCFLQRKDPYWKPSYRKWGLRAFASFPKSTVVPSRLLVTHTVPVTTWGSRSCF